MLIAVSALLISAIAAVTSVLQTRVFANQLSAAVWPYLAYSWTTSSDFVRFSTENDGLGPAILKSASLTIDGQPSKSFTVGFSQIEKQPRRTTLSTSSVGVGEVLRPDASVTLLEYKGAGARAVSATLKRRLRLTICYCSLLDQCWTLTSSESKGPGQVASCPQETSVDS